MIEWVKCSDKLPNESGFYLICYDPQKDNSWSVMLAIYDRHGRWSQLPTMDDINGDYISHWAAINLPNGEMCHKE